MRRRRVGDRVSTHSALALWGSHRGVQFSLSLVVLKALPVLIIAGLTSISGAIGGLIIGAAEKVAEVYLGAIIGGGLQRIALFVRAAYIDSCTLRSGLTWGCGRRRLTTSSPMAISRARVMLRLSPSRLAVCTWLQWQKR